MTDTAPDQQAPVPVTTPEQRRRNRVLGWLLAAFVLTVVVAFMALFTARGLPKTPEVVERLLREQSAQDPSPPTSTSATSPIGAGDKGSTVAPAQEPAR